MTQQQPTMDDLQNEIIRLNKMVSALIKRADTMSTEKMTDFSLFQTQVMLQDEVNNRTEQLENALLENQQINSELIRIQQKMAKEIEEKKSTDRKIGRERPPASSIRKTGVYRATCRWNCSRNQ